jgi:hypothetical protein
MKLTQISYCISKRRSCLNVRRRIHEFHSDFLPQKTAIEYVIDEKIGSPLKNEVVIRDREKLVSKIVLCSLLNITPKTCSKEDMRQSYDLDLRSFCK